MKDIPKKRTIKLNPPVNDNTENLLKTELSKLEGITHILLDRNGFLHLEYNLQKTNLQRIECRLIELGFNLSDSLWTKLKRGWIHFIEQNEYDNMHAGVQLCCSDPTEHRRY